MFYSQAAYDEAQEAAANDAMSDGEWRSAAVAEYAREHGRMSPDRAWILSPFDSWEANPFYTGPRVAHPEDDANDVPDDYFDSFKAATAYAAREAAATGRCVTVARCGDGWMAC